MFASVIPLVRLPKNLGQFSYTIPSELCGQLLSGHLVTVSFRNKKTLALVTAVGDSQPEAGAAELLQIINLACPAPLVTPAEQAFLRKQAELYGVHESVMLKMFLPPLQKKKLQSGNRPARTVSPREANSASPTYYTYGNQAERAALLQKLTAAPALTLIPGISSVVKTAAELAAEKQIIVWHSELTDKERFASWFSAARGEWHVIVGARDALWLPFLPYLKTIIIDEEQSAQYKNWDQAPRFQAKDVARELAADFGLNYCEMSYSPSFTSFYFARKGMFGGELKLPADKKIPPEIAQLTSAPGENNLLHQSIEDAVAKIDKDDIVLLINRRGHSHALICRDCGHRPVCAACDWPLVYTAGGQLLVCYYCQTSEPLPLVCSRCGSTLLKLLGPGIEKIFKHASELAAGTNRKVLQVEGGSKPPAGENRPLIIVGTDGALPHIRYQRTSLIALLDIDQALHWPEYSATEEAWHRLQEIQFKKRDDARIVLQTGRPEHLFFRSLLEPERLYRTELNFRRKTGYPPYVGLVRYLFSHKNKNLALQMAAAGASNIKKLLTANKKTAIVHDPLPLQPHFYRGRYHYAVAVKLAATAWTDEVRAINHVLSGEWRVDPNPARLLQL